MVVGKAYADWVSRAPELKGASQFIHDPPSLYAAGIEPVYVPTRLPLRGAYHSGRTVSVKNSVDVKMTADCIDTAHNFPNINTFVLVSGDSDFIHVINSLRAVGKRVLVVGVSWATSRRMADHVDGLIFYDSDVDPIDAEPEPEPAVRSGPGPYQRSRAPAPAALSNPGRHQLPEVIRAIEDVIRTERAAGHRLLLTSLKQRLVRRIAGFDERKLGFSGFKKLMLRVADEGNIKIRSVDLVDWVLMADEPDPVPEARDEEDETPETTEVSAADTDANTATETEAPPAPETTEVRVANAATDTVAPPVPAPAAVAPPPEPPRPPAPAADRPARPASRPSVISVADADTDPYQLFRALAETIIALDLPPDAGPGDCVNRIADLVTMAHTLEERDGADAVMFNALCGEVSQAIAAGIDAADPTIVAHWGNAGMTSKVRITRLVRSMASKNIFEYRNISARDPETRRLRRRRVFSLNRAHPLVEMALALRLGRPWEPPATSSPPAPAPTPSRAPSAEPAPQPPADAGDAGETMATPPLDETHPAEAEGLVTAEDAEAAVLSR